MTVDAPCRLLLPFLSQGPEEMCLSLEHQNPSKTSEKMGYFDRVTVSFHGRYFIYDSYSVPIYRFLYCTLSSSSVLDFLGTWLTFVS